MKYTLLDMTQSILASLSSDEVNSIGDTTESAQVAEIIKQKYFDIVNRVPLTEHDQLIQLDPSLDATIPVLMYVPAGIAELKWLKYYDSNTEDGASPGYRYINILSIQDFIDMVNTFNTTESNVDTFTFTDNNNGYNTSYTFNYKNDLQPANCTIISNYYVIFDSFDNTQDTTLQASKTMGSGRIVPHWSTTDTFIPNLAEEQFQLLLNEAKALAFYELKQQPHALALQETKRGWSNVQKNKAVINRPTNFDELPNFGRRSGVGYPGPRGLYKGNLVWL